MCRWACPEFNSTFMCKWCGTRYCRECLRGDFTGLMRDSTTCAKCNQKRCQGQRVETVSKEYLKEDDGSGKKGSRSTSSNRRSTSANRGKSPSVKAKPAGSNKSKSSTGKKKKRNK